MRKLTDFHDGTTAKALGDYLLSKGIGNQVDEEDVSLWSVWVHDDDHLDDARGHLEFFRANPTHADIRRAMHQATEIRAEQKREIKEARSKPVDMRTHWHLESMRPPAVTTALVLISLVVFVIQRFVPEGGRLANWLFISENVYGFRIDGETMRHGMPFTSSLAYALWYVIRGKISLLEVLNGNYWLSEVLHGQVWRLFTPMFLHFGFLHIFFNMSWIVFLGPMIEKRKSWWLLLVMVLVISLVSNLAQYMFHGPRFGGMSGVVSGLFGYVWMMARYNSGAGLWVDRNTVIYFVAFLLLALAGLMGPIANTAHFAGLFTGMIWGYIDSGRFGWKLRRQGSRSSSK